MWIINIFENIFQELKFHGTLETHLKLKILKFEIPTLVMPQ